MILKCPTCSAPLPNADTLDYWLRIAGTASAEELRRLLDGVINIGIVMTAEFERRFPVEYARYEQDNQ